MSHANKIITNKNIDFFVWLCLNISRSADDDDKENCDLDNSQELDTKIKGELSVIGTLKCIGFYEFYKSQQHISVVFFFRVYSSGCVPPHCQITLKCTKEVGNSEVPEYKNPGTSCHEFKLIIIFFSLSYLLGLDYFSGGRFQWTE